VSTHLDPAGRRVKLAIVRAGRTQRQICDLAHIHEVKLSKIITGHAVPSTTERAALSAVLGEDFFDESAVGSGRR